MEVIRDLREVIQFPMSYFQLRDFFLKLLFDGLTVKFSFSVLQGEGCEESCLIYLQ